MAEPRTLPPGSAALQPRPSWRAIQRHGWLAAMAALAAAGGVAMSRWPADAYLLVAAFAPATLSAPAPGPLLLQARERGVLRVGVREYPRPSLPSDPLPPEPDSYDAGLARHIAQQLSVRVQLVGLAPEQVAAATAAGQVDLVLAGSPTGSASAPTPTRGTVPYVKGPARVVALRKGPMARTTVQARERGVLRVGVREYPRPSLPSDPLPPEPDSYDAGLARHIAQQLGVKVQLVGLAPEQVAAATAADQVDLVLVGSPTGSASAPIPTRSTVPYVKGPARVVALRKGPMARTTDLNGQAVCVAQGSPYAEPLRDRLGARPVQYRSAVHAVSAFMAGECAALAEDEGLLQRLLAQTEWRFYRLLDDAIAPAPSAQVQLAQADPESARHLDALLDQWHAQGLEAQARLQRTSEIMLEVALLQDGAICH